MAKTVEIASVTTKLYELLSPLESEDRKRVIAATLTLLGDDVQSIPTGGSGQANQRNFGGGANSDAGEFFKTKDPHDKGEELAVAARFREINEGTETHERSDLESVIKGARRNFDNKNFKRDLDNAKRKGLFTKGKEITLAYFGQQYVDALPDRESLKSMRKPRVGSRKSTKKVKTSGKKP
jgi:hypothetical protein